MNVKNFFFTQMLYAQAVHDMIRPDKQETKTDAPTTPEEPKDDDKKEDEAPSSPETGQKEAPSTQSVKKSSKKTVVSE